MIKPVTANSITKRIVLTTMLTAGVIATGNTKLNAQDYNKNQYEIVSPEAADSIKARTFYFTVPKYEHNKKLDKLYLKDCELDRTQKNKRETLKAIYKVYGTYGAAIELQRIIDEQYIDNVFKSYLDYFIYIGKGTTKAENQISDFKQWMNSEFFTDLYKKELEVYSAHRYPNSKQALKMLDKHIKNTKYFSPDDVEFYENHSKLFEARQKENHTIQAKSDLVAFKTHLLNALAFKNYLLEDNKIADTHSFIYYFNNEFVNGKNSIKP